jgi:hypothetical protein
VTGLTRAHATIATIATALVTACSSAATPPQPDVVVTGDTLRVDVRTTPDPPWQGTITAELTVTNKVDGTPQDGLTIAVVPWMPADDHGTSITPVVSPEGGGKYLVTQVDFFMAGHWELQTTFSGPVTDHVVPAYDVP